MIGRIWTPLHEGEARFARVPPASEMASQDWSIAAVNFLCDLIPKALGPEPHRHCLASATRGRGKLRTALICVQDGPMGPTDPEAVNFLCDLIPGVIASELDRPRLGPASRGRGKLSTALAGVGNGIQGLVDPQQ